MKQKTAIPKLYFGLILILLCIGISEVKAQQKSWIGASFGVGLPLGQFSNESGLIANNGYAQFGYSANIVDMGANISDHFGFTSSIGGAINNFKTKEAFITYPELIGDVKPWRQYNYLVGLYYKPLSNQWLFIRGLMGAAMLLSPEVSISNNDASVDIPSIIGGGFAYDFGIGMIIPITTKIGVLITYDYFSTNFQGKTYASTTSTFFSQKNVDLYELNYRLNYELFSAKLGLSFTY